MYVLWLYVLSFSGATETGKNGKIWKGRGKSQSVKDWFSDYNPTENFGVKTDISQAAHDWMFDQLVQWQLAHTKDANVRPQEIYWYYIKRIEGIEAGLIPMTAGWDVVRSYLKGKAEPDKDGYADE